MLQLNGPGGLGLNRGRHWKVTVPFVSIFCSFCLKSIFHAPIFAIMGTSHMCPRQCIWCTETDSIKNIPLQTAWQPISSRQYVAFIGVLVGFSLWVLPLLFYLPLSNFIDITIYLPIFFRENRQTHCSTFIVWVQTEFIIVIHIAHKSTAMTLSAGKHGEGLFMDLIE